MTEESRQNYQLARDLVLAAFITLNRKKQPTDRGMIGMLQQYLNMHRGKHGDLMNVVSGINDPKRAERLKLTDAQQQAKRRALDILESLSESEIGWIELKVDDPGKLGGIASAFLVPESDVITDDTGMTIGIKVGKEVIGTDAAQAEQQSKAKPGRKKQNPIEAATAKATKNTKPCCN
jgi:hypothetical protein